MSDLENMTLNYNLDDLKYYDIDSKLYDARYDYKLFTDNLYIIVEKEKYLQNKFDYHSSLLDNLTDKAKELFIKIFHERMRLYYQENEIEDEPKFVDYFTTVDKYCEKYFDKLKFEKGTSFTLTKNHPNASLFEEGYTLESTRGIKHVRYVISDEKTGKTYRSPFKLLKDLNDKYKPKKVLNFVIYYDYFTGLYDIYDLEWNKIGSAKNYYIDYANGNIIIIDIEGNIEVRDKKYNHLYFFRKNDIYDDNYTSFVIVNDGVIVSRNITKTSYYNYLTGELIDSFNLPKQLQNITAYLNSPFIYSNGLYNYVDEKTELQGYKDINKNIVIEPKLKSTAPFLGNIAYFGSGNYCWWNDKTEKRNEKQYLLDKNGIKYSMYDYFNKFFDDSIGNMIRANTYFHYDMLTSYDSHWKIEPSMEKQMYRLSKYNEYAYMLGKDCYMANDDTKIKDIDFGVDKDKIMIK